MMYLVSTFAAGAAALELRNLAIDTGKTKIEYNGHGLADGQIVKASVAIGGDGDELDRGLKANAMYVVDGATTNDFKLKSFKAADAKGENAVTFQDTTNDGGTITKHGSKKCNISAMASGEGGEVTCAANHGMANGDALWYYPTETTGGKLFNGSFTATGKAFWASDIASGTPKKLKLKETKDAGSANSTDSSPHAHATTGNNWLLSVDSGSFYATAPKTLAADGGAWTSSTAHGGAADNWVGLCGATACGVANTASYYYTAGSAASTPLVGGKVYFAVVASATPWQFTLKDHSAVNPANVGTAVKVTASGVGDSYQKVTEIRQITASAKTAGTITILGDNSANGYAADVVMMFYCRDTTTAADCDYKVTGMSSGSTFKVLAVANTLTASTAATLKAATGTDATAIVVTANSSATKGYAMKKSDDAAVVFPAAAAGSAARSFAMLGSAVAMATAFLLA